MTISNGIRIFLLEKDNFRKMGQRGEPLTWDILPMVGNAEPDAMG